jgi:hypothetical protein
VKSIENRDTKLLSRDNPTARIVFSQFASWEGWASHDRTEAPVQRLEAFYAHDSWMLNSLAPQQRSGCHMNSFTGNRLQQNLNAPEQLMKSEQNLTVAAVTTQFLYLCVFIVHAARCGSKYLYATSASTGRQESNAKHHILDPISRKGHPEQNPAQYISSERLSAIYFLHVSDARIIRASHHS